MNGSPPKIHTRNSFRDEELSKTTDTPTLFRKFLRDGLMYKQSTAGVCPGYVQTNVFMLPVMYSAGFQQFCSANSGPLPLLFASAEGQFDAPTLTTEESSDIRTDIPAYKVFGNGKHVTTKQDLLEFTELLKKYCFFYVGCSFSFDRLLTSEGIPLRYTNGKGTGNVSMYKTNIMCNKRGRFEVELVVSMRPIRRDMVDRVIEISLPLTAAHGAPVHIGDPAIIGITDLTLDEYYESMTYLEPGEVPVFWACGVTGLEAMKSVESATTFSHCGGSMFITDLKLSNDARRHSSTLKNIPKVIWLKEDPPTASVTSEAALHQLEQLITATKDKHGISNTISAVRAERFVKEVLSLSHASTVGILMADIPLSIDNKSDISDGLPDSLQMALYLRKLGKNVTCFCDSDNCLALKTLMQRMVDSDLSLLPLSISTCHKLLNVDEQSCNGQQNIPRGNKTIVVEALGSVVSMTEETDRRRSIDMHISVGAPSKICNNAIPGHSQLNVETVCRALYALYTDSIHDRYRRRGLGHPLEDDEKHWLESISLKLNQVNGSED